jgi:hypothetical protein
LSDRSQQEVDWQRRTLLTHYAVRSIFGTAVSILFIVAFLVELVFLSNATAFPQFLLYPLLFLTVAPALFFLYSAVFWWRTGGYAFSVATEETGRLSLQEMNELCLELSHQGMPGFILPGGRSLDAQLAAVGILAVAIVSIPVSYFASNVLHAGLLLGAVVAALFWLAIGLVLMLLYLVARRERVVWLRRIDELLAGLRDLSQQFYVASSQAGNQQERTDQLERILMHELTTLMIGVLNQVETMKVWITSAQKRELAGVVASINTSMISLGLDAEAQRISASYKATELV